MSEWIQTPVTAEAVERVRAGLSRRIRRRRHVRRGAGLLALAATAAGAFWPTAPDVERLALAPPLPPAYDQPLRKTPMVPTVRAATRPAERITIFTPDPDVVIVLVADGGE